MLKYAAFLATSTFAASAAAAEIEDLAAAFAEVDNTALVYTVFLTECEAQMLSDHRDSWVAHRSFIIASLSEVYPSRDRALIRYDEMEEWAKGREAGDTDINCGPDLDHMRHELDVAVAKMNETRRN